MSEKQFFGREQELAVIRRELDRARPSVLIVRGRRRVGKSRLLLEATRGYPTIYYQATKIAGSMSLHLLKAEVSRVIGTDPVLESLSDWLGVLTYLEQVAAEAMPGLTVVLDEFPYLCDTDPALPSILQKFCDEVRERGTRLNLVLCGSKISFMEELLGEKNPLHGRQALDLDLGPLSYRDAARFFPEWSMDEQLRAYGILGGIPYYLKLCEPEFTLSENVLHLVLSVAAPLSDEPNNLLQAEVRDVTRYATILRAVAEGCTDSGAIIGRVRELKDSSALAPYVQKLAELRLIRIVRSLDATERERDRRYYLDDPFLAFWYRFYLPNLSPLAAGHVEEVWRHTIEPRLDDHMGGMFEWICRDYARRYVNEVLPTAAQEVGQIWAADYDLDVAGRLLNGAAIAGECKWWGGPMGMNVLQRLRDTATRSSYERDARERYLLLFSRSGFTAELKRERKRDPYLRLIGPAELLNSPHG
ncbi:MAG TPA: ATP-binding protein [Longimicrobium sp.]|nr:ATP-binding protein [Longimicrobium sp.]